MDSSQKKITALIAPLLDFTFPSYCQICEQQLRGVEEVCNECKSLFTPQSGIYCLTCAEQIHKSEQLGEECVHCRDSYFAFEFVVVAYVMNSHLRHCIHTFKYGRGLHLSSFLISCLAQAFLDDRCKALSPSEWVITSVPVHHIRERERGFDQSKILASGVSQKIKFPYQELLMRVEHTPHQARLNKKQRVKNIKGAFALKGHTPVPPNLILIDDVFTTGATTNSCTQVLKRNGAKKVIVVCLARK